MKKFLIALLLIPTILFSAENSFDRFNPIGSVVTMATQSCPQGYLSGDGARVSRVTYSKLFLALGTIYGIGDGTTTFNLPDYRGQFMRGANPALQVVGTGTAASSNATFTNHGYNRTGVKVRMVSGALTGLTATTVDYYVIYIDQNTLAFATSLANALAGTKIAISGVNTATIRSFADGDTLTRVIQNGVVSNAVGSIQEDSTQGHQHSGSGVSSTYAAGSFGTVVQYNSATNVQVTYGVISDGANGTPRVSNETRSKNIYVLYCIKY